MNIGKAIYTCRVKRRLSQKEVAARADCSTSYLSMLENSQRDPTLSTISKIAEALNVPVEILFLIGADNGELNGISLELSNQLRQAVMDILSDEPITQAA